MVAEKVGIEGDQIADSSCRNRRPFSPGSPGTGHQPLGVKVAVGRIPVAVVGSGSARGPHTNEKHRMWPEGDGVQFFDRSRRPRMKRHWIKMHDKGTMLWIEMVINSPEEFHVRRPVRRQGRGADGGGAFAQERDVAVPVSRDFGTKQASRPKCLILTNWLGRRCRRKRANVLSA